jgi:putative addiction module component (TIGR02574 family)
MTPFSRVGRHDATVDEAAEAAWNQEIARRIEDLDSGKAKTIPWEEVRSSISSKLTE